jgi:cbb3-type cytochrome oxidase subunit 3
MKMVKSILSQVEGLDTFAIVIMLFFFALFIAVGIWLLTLKKGHYSQASLMPFEEDPKTEETYNETSNQ